MKTRIYVMVLVAALMAGTVPATAAKALAGKTYFMVTLGVASDEAEAYELDAGCVRFTRRKICDSDNDCGAWWWMQEERRARQQRQLGFEFQLIDDETGLPLEIQGIGRVDSRGPRSSIAGTAHGVELTSGTSVNFALAGRAVGKARCERLVADFLADRQ